FQCLQERNHVADFLIAENTMTAPWRHHRIRVVHARVVDVVEEPLVFTPGISDLGKIRADIAWKVGTPRGSHHVTCKARTASITVGYELGAIGSVAAYRIRKLARRLGSRRRGNMCKRAPLGFIACWPAGIALPRPYRGITLCFKRSHLALSLRIGKRPIGDGK